MAEGLGGRQSSVAGPDHDVDQGAFGPPSWNTPWPVAGSTVRTTAGLNRKMNLLVNGSVRSVESPPDKPLLWVLREDLGLTGTKYGCGIGRCGSCMVHLDGVAVPSCMLPLAAAEGLAVTTIEGAAAGGRITMVQQAWLDHGVSQCGYCQPGMIMGVLALLGESPRPSAAGAAARLNVLCRCGTYPRVLKALRALLGS